MADAGSGQPVLHGTHRASGGVDPHNADDFAGGLLVGLAAGNGQPNTLVADGEVHHIKRDDLAAPKGRRKSRRNDGAITQIAQQGAADAATAWAVTVVVGATRPRIVPCRRRIPHKM